MTDVKKRLASYFQYLRFKHNKSIQDVADGTGLQRSQIYRLEEGEVDLKVSWLEEISDFFGEPPEKFWTQTDIPETNLSKD